MKAFISLLATAALVAGVRAESTITMTDKHAWAGNTGWVDFRPESGNGFRFGEFSCAGWLWSPNTGWINCGDGTPANGINYENGSNTDFGVNHYGTGDLYGMAWSPNTGWINFGWATSEPGNAGRPRVDLVTGEFSGFAWSANCGWISLAGVRTGRMEVLDTDNDGISDAFEIAYAGNIGTLRAKHDQDGDGTSDKDEYVAMTNPFDPGSFFKVTKLEPASADGSATKLTWTSAPNRRYLVEHTTDLGIADPWHLSALDPATGFSADAGEFTTRTTLDTAAPRRFFRVTAVIPLQP